MPNIWLNARVDNVLRLADPHNSARQKPMLNRRQFSYFVHRRQRVVRLNIKRVRDLSSRASIPNINNSFKISHFYLSTSSVIWFSTYNIKCLLLDLDFCEKLKKTILKNNKKSNKSAPHNTNITPMPIKKKKKKRGEPLLIEYGNVLLFQPVTRPVPSALRSLTSVFGMRTGGTSSAISP